MEISVIIPNYNGERYICQCLESLIKQSFHGEYEIIVVDDGSTDSSIEKIKSLESPRIKLFEKKVNSGPSDSRNLAMTKASGTFLCFVDSDDVVASNYLEQLHAAISKNTIDLAVCEFFGFQSEIGNEVQEKVALPDQLDSIRLRISLLEGTCSSVVWDKIYKRSIIARYNISFPIGLVNEDIIFNYKYFEHVERAVVVREPLYFYRQHPNSITKHFKRKILDDMLSIYFLLKKSLHSNSSHHNELRNSLRKFFSFYVGVTGVKRALKLRGSRAEAILHIASFFKSELRWSDLWTLTMSKRQRAICTALKILSTVR